MAEIDFQPFEHEPAAIDFQSIEAAPISTPPKPQPSFMQNLARPFVTTGSEAMAGLKEAFLPKYSSEDPGLFEQLVSTPASQVMGLTRAVMSPLRGFVGEPAEIVTQQAGKLVGLPEQLTDVLARTAGLGAEAMSPTSLVTAPLQAVRSTLRTIARPGFHVIPEAEALSGFNQAQNVLVREARAKAKRAEEAVGQRRGMNISAPLAGKIAAKQSDEEAYAFLNQLEAPPEIKLNNLTSAAKGLLEKFTGVPKSTQPTQAARTASDISALAPEPAVAAAAIPNMPGLPAFDKMTDLQREAWAPVITEMSKTSATGGLALDKLQIVQQKIGTLTRHSDPPTALYANYLYKKLFDDVRAAAPTSPEAAQFLAATKVSRQNHGAEDVADIITGNGTRIDDITGRLKVVPGTIMKQIQKNELLDDFPPEEAKLMAKTLENVFRARTRERRLGPLRPDIVAPKGPEAGFKSVREGFLSAPGFAGGMAGAALGELAGIPHYYAFAAGNMAASALPRAIFRAAQTANGRKLLEALYRDAPPTVVGQSAQMATIALNNFLRSQGMAQGGM